MRERVVIVGAGIGGLAAAIDLTARGLDVTVVEAAERPGGKLREATVDGRAIDVGPTVFTMKPVFDSLFAAAGERLEDHLTLTPASVLARHAWPDGAWFDLHADPERATDAVGDLSGAAEARRFRAFLARAKRIHDVLARPFLHAQKPSLAELTLGIGLHRPADQWTIMPYRSLWAELGRYFHDPRLRQLFGRYATYCGSSPFRSPATLMLVAHVEQSGVWLVEGGMGRIPEALARVADKLGARLRYGASVARVLVERGRASGVELATGERISADFVVVNADPAALAAGLLGHDIAPAVARRAPRERSLSAVTHAFAAEVDAPLLRHTVLFSPDYPAEFQALHAGRLPERPTVYLCAQDRPAYDAPASTGLERVLAIVNAPADGDRRPYTEEEIAECRTRTFDSLARCGVRLRPTGTVSTETPADFARRFPGTGGALYGPAGHGPLSAFQRPGARTTIPGLYLAGGSTHPGAGVPMAALSGRLAASALTADLASTRRWVRAATPGGTSMRSAPAVSTA